MRQNYAEYKSVSISHYNRRQTHLNGVTSELNLTENGTDSLRDCQCPATRTNKHTSCKFPKPTILPKGLLSGWGPTYQTLLSV